MCCESWILMDETWSRTHLTHTPFQYFRQHSKKLYWTIIRYELDIDTWQRFLHLEWNLVEKYTCKGTNRSLVWSSQRKSSGKYALWICSKSWKKIDEVHWFGRDNIKQSTEVITRYYDLGSQQSWDTPTKKKGESPKLVKRWDGPYVVLRHLNVKLKCERTKPKVFISIGWNLIVKPYFTRDQ